MCVLILNWVHKFFLIIMLYALHSAYFLKCSNYSHTTKSDNESMESELLLSADSDLLRFQKTGCSKLSHRSKKYRNSLTKCVTQNFRYFTSQQAKMLHKFQKGLVSKPSQNIVTSVVVIHIFQTFSKQEIQCRRMDSSETLHIGRLKILCTKILAAQNQAEQCEL